MAQQYDVAVAGLQCLDLLVDSVDETLFQRDSTPVESVAMSLGGDALNQAVTLCSLGSKTALLGVTGKDLIGDALLALLGRYPMDIYNQRVDGRTTISVVLVDKNRERHFVRQPGRHNDYLSFDHLNLNVIKNARFLSIGGFMALPSLDGPGLSRLLGLAKQWGVKTVMDFHINRTGYNMDDIKKCIALADYLLPSKEEAGYITGEKENPRLMALAFEKMGASNVVIKLGSEGCYLAAGGRHMHIPSCKAHLVDSTGAGDNFSAAFIHALARGWDEETCARFACAAGAIAVEHLGACGAITGESQVLARMEET